MIEQWGSGIRRIFAEATAQGLPEPVITEIATGIRLSIRLRSLMPLPHAIKGPRAQSGAQSRAQSIMILNLLQAQPLSSNELMLQMGLQTKTGAFKRAIKELLEQGQIEYTMPDRIQSRM